MAMATPHIHPYFHHHDPRDSMGPGTCFSCFSSRAASSALESPEIFTVVALEFHGDGKTMENIGIFMDFIGIYRNL